MNLTPSLVEEDARVQAQAWLKDQSPFIDAPEPNALECPESATRVYGERRWSRENEKVSDEHLDLIITHARCALDGARSIKKPSIVACVLALASSLEQRYRKTWRLDNVDERILLYEEAQTLISADPGAIHQGQSSAPPLGSLLFITADTPSYLTQEDAEEYLRLFGLHQTLTECGSALYSALADRYKHTGRIPDVERQVELCRNVLSRLHEVDPRWAEASYRLGSALRTRYEAHGDSDDLKEAVLAIHEALRLRTEGFAEATYLREMGCLLGRRYQATGDGADILQAIELQRQALRACSLDHTARYACLAGLGDALWVQFISEGTPASIEESISVFGEALILCTPGHRDRHTVLNGLGLAYIVLFQHSPKIESLSTAIDFHRQALALRPRGHPDRGKSLNNLAGSLRLRFSRLGHLEDLTGAIQLLQEFYDLYPPDHFLHCSAANSLGNALQYLYHHGGDESHLEQAIKMQREAVETCPVGSDRRTSTLNNLGDALRLRYDRYKDPTDLTESIYMLREANATSPPSDIDRGTHISNLASALTNRAKDMSSVLDVDEAIELLTAYLKTGSASNHLQSSYLHRLSQACELRFQLLGNIKDLSVAVTCGREAIGLRPPGHPRREDAISNLASNLRVRFQATGSMEDALEAMQLLEDVLTLLPLGHPSRAAGLCQMAYLFHTQGTSFYDIEKGLDFLQKSLDDPHRNAQMRVEDAMGIFQALNANCMLADITGGLRVKLLQTYKTTVNLLPRVAYFGLNIHSRLRVLANAENLASNGAFLALDMSNSRLAVEILEQGRGVFWTQYLRLRTPFDELPEELAEKLKEVSGQLERGSVGESLNGENGEFRSRATIENEAAQRRVLGEEFEILVIAARTRPGFDRFMLYDTYPHLAHVADKGPVLILLATEHACRGILIKHSTGEPLQIQFPGLHIARLRKLRGLLNMANRKTRDQTESRAIMRVVSSRKSELGANEILAELWSDTMQVVVKALGFSKAEGRHRPRLFLCATGAFAHLPLHAAGVYQRKTSANGCSDYFVTSYTPTLGALLMTRRNFNPVNRSSARSLIAAVPKPFKGTLLPHATVEARLVGSILNGISTAGMVDSGDFPHHQLVDATIGDVISKLPGVNLLHMACHGHQNLSNPLESGFACADGTLTVAKLMALNLPSALFAFLSACETAKGDQAQPDQVIHLAAAMLFVGFKSVIGTLWSMGDIDGPTVAKHVYEGLDRKDALTIDLDIIPYALDAAATELRVKGLHPSRWAPFVHIGM